MSAIKSPAVPSPPWTHCSIMSISILWDPCLPPMVLCICSPALTASRGGQTLYLSRTVLPTRWPKHWFRDGFLDLVYPPLSPQTAEDSLNQTCGRPLLSYLVINTYTQLLTTPSPMDLSSGSTDTLRVCSESLRPTCCHRCFWGTFK